MCEPFWDVKTENGIFGKIQKIKTHNRHAFYTTTVNIFTKIGPVHNSRGKFCTRLFNNKIIKILDDKMACPFCGAIK